MKSKEFLKSLAEYAAQLRQTIEAEADGFDASPAAIAERRAKVLDPVNGYEYFVNTYFPHYVRSSEKSELHEFLFSRLPEILQQPEGINEADAAPRGEAKSTLVTRLFSLWTVITGAKKFIVIAMDSIDQAYPMLEAIKAELEFNPRLKTDFPEMCGQGRVWQAGTIVTASNVKIQVFGSGKKMRGMVHGAFRPDLAILDDIENDEMVRNPDQRDKLEMWLKQTVLPLGAVGTKFDVIYIGTILHYDSVLTDKTPIAVLQELAQAAGGFVESDRARPVVRFKPKWKKASWEVSDAPADVSVPVSVIFSISGQRNVSERANGVYVWPSHNKGKGADVYRNGSNREPRASALTNTLYTDQPVLLAAGIAALSETGVHKRETVSLPVSDKYAIPMANLGEIWQINEPTGSWQGVVVGVSVEVKIENDAPVVTQNLTIDRYFDE